MNTVKGRPIHQRLLIASYVLSSIGTLLGALAALGATIDHGKLEYPPVSNGATPPLPTSKSSDAGKKYFET